MDLWDGNHPELTTKQILFKGEDTLKQLPVKLEKQCASLPKIKTMCCPPPSVIQTLPTLVTSIPKRAESAERRPNATSPMSSSPTSPSARHSGPSSPLLRPAAPSFPTSKPSTTSSASSRSTSPLRDSILEKQNSSRRAFVGRSPDGLWPSMRGLSSSFWPDSFIHDIKDSPARGASPDSKGKNSSTSTALSERKKTPVSVKNTPEQSEISNPVQSAHSRVVDQHRWPAMSGGKVSTMSFSKSTDLTDRIGKSASLVLQSRGLSPTRRVPVSDGIIKRIFEEVAQQSFLKATAKNQQDMSLGASMVSFHAEKEKPPLAASRTLSLPMVSPRRSSSPNSVDVLSSSISKGASSLLSPRPSSPVRSSNGVTNKNDISALVVNQIIDIRKGMEDAGMEDAHQLRLLHNRELQWHFVYYRAEVAFATQKITAENKLKNAWNATSELLDIVTMKRINIDSLKLEMKLEMLLKEQVFYLEDFIALEGEHSTSLYGTIGALQASVLRLPVIGGARAGVQAIKNAVSSAIDIMQAMGLSVCSLLSRVDGTKRLVSQLFAVAAKEKAMLDECRVLLAATTTMQGATVVFLWWRRFSLNLQSQMLTKAAEMTRRIIRKTSIS